MMLPEAVQKLLQALGGRPHATNITLKVMPVPEIMDPYRDCEWTKLRSVVRLLGQIAKSMPQKTRTYTICTLLRLSIDGIVLENVDLLSLVQETVHSLSKFIPDGLCEVSHREICASMFNYVEQATLRLQVVRCMPVTSLRLHDLRRRLAMAFYYDDLAYSIQPSHLLIDLYLITKRLDDPPFKINERTDYHELAALISLLDIAVDNGQSVQLDLKDEQVERHFNEDVDALDARIKTLWSSINDAGASFISRIEAKEVMEAVRHRLIYAVRTQPRPKRSVFDEEVEEDLDRERNSMRNFLSKKEIQA